MSSPQLFHAHTEAALDRLLGPRPPRPIPTPEPTDFMEKILDASVPSVAQTIMVNDVATKSYARDVAYPKTKAKEIDSGLPVLEIPGDWSRPSAIPDSPVSTASAPPSTNRMERICLFSATVACTPAVMQTVPDSTAARRLQKSREAPEIHSFVAHFRRAQEHAPALATVFVGNLPRLYTTLQLYHEVFNLFSQFGEVAVYIHNSHFAPHAFCQFTYFQDAERAIAANGMVHIGSRPLRTQISESVRCLCVRRKDEEVGSDYEVRRIFSQYGLLQSIVRNPIIAATLVQFVKHGGYTKAKRALLRGIGEAGYYYLVN